MDTGGPTHDSPGQTTTTRGSRRQLALTVLCAGLGAVVTVLAAGRVWAVELTPQPPPLPELRNDYTGGDLRPWLPALGWVALAGAVALLATRGAWRRLVGALLGLAGVVVAVAAGAVLGGGPGPAAGELVGLGWPVLTGLSGLLVAAGGGVAVWRGDRWPAMGVRYERPGRQPCGGGRSGGERPEELWDALDRGEDPTTDA